MKKLDLFSQNMNSKLAQIDKFDKRIEQLEKCNEKNEILD